MTAPGDRRHRRWGGTTGPWCECTPAAGVDLAAWNSRHSDRWNHFRTVVRRDQPGLQFFRGIEVQDGKRRLDKMGRGALHDHVLMWSPTALKPSYVRDLAIRCGFGHSVDVAPLVAGSRKAAHYVSKYITKATDSRGSVPWLGDVVNKRTGEVTVGLVPGRYRTWSSSRDWPEKMAAVRAANAHYAQQLAARRAALGTGLAAPERVPEPALLAGSPPT